GPVANAHRQTAATRWICLPRLPRTAAYRLVLALQQMSQTFRHICVASYVSALCDPIPRHPLPGLRKSSTHERVGQCPARRSPAVVTTGRVGTAEALEISRLRFRSCRAQAGSSRRWLWYGKSVPSKDNLSCLGSAG